MGKPDRNEIDHLVDIFLDGVILAAEGAGRFGDCILGKSIEYAGYSPNTTRPGQHDAAMIHAAVTMRKPHRKFQLAKALLKRLETRQRMALVSVRYYKNRVNEEGRRVGNAQLAALMGISQDQFKLARRQGYDTMIDGLSLVRDAAGV